jgi:purine-nucleoside phosphorylase
MNGCSVSASIQCSHVEEAVNFITLHIPPAYAKPAIGIVCGSGLSNLVGRMVETVELSYERIPNFPKVTVQGHGTKLVIGKLNGVVAACLLGRFHYYEGHDAASTAFPIRILAKMGVRSVLLTNAAGALDTGLNVGDIMWIEDHISFPSLSGVNPLRGVNASEFGPRFPSLTLAYDPKGFEILLNSAKKANMSSSLIRRGVYVMVGGPSYETRAEVRFLRMIGGHAVGMSTIPEVITAIHCGLKVLAFSLVTNVAVDDLGIGPTHEEVLEATRNSSGKLESLVYYLAPSLLSLSGEGIQ